MPIRTNLDNLLEFERLNKSSGQRPETLESASQGLTGIPSMEPMSGSSSYFPSFVESSLQQGNILTQSQLEKTRFRRFSRTKILDPWNQLGYLTEYDFFTKPDLHIFANSSLEINPVLDNSEFFAEAIATNEESLKALQQTYVTPGNSWNYLLSNYVANSIDMPAISSETTLGNQNLYGINTFYQDSSRSQSYNFDFTVEFTDTAFLDVFYFFKAYQEYKNLQYDIDILPVKAAYIGNMNRYKSFSVYKLLVDDVGRIIYYGKHIGCEPLNCPSDTIDSLDGTSTPRFSIAFKAFHSVELYPWILTEINLLSRRAGFNGDVIPTYNNADNAASKEWGAVPIIVSSTYKNRKVHLLKWGRV